MAVHRKSPIILLLSIVCLECFGVEDTFFFVEPYDVTQVFSYESSFSVTSTLSCGVVRLHTGSSVAWYKNGRQISSDGRVDGNVVNSSRYTVDVFPRLTWIRFNLQIKTSVADADTDSGNYYCRVMTTPPLVSREARFDVFVIPRYGYLQCSIGDHSENDVFDVTEGIEIRLSCHSDPTGVPEMTTYWTGQGPQGDTFDTNTTTSTEIRNGSRVLSFSWTPTNQQNGATLVCTRFHPGYNTNKTCQLGPFNVLYRPIVQLSPSSFTVTMASQGVIFTCIADANPPVTRYEWSNTAGEKFSVQGDNVLVGPDGKWMKMENFWSQDNGVYYVTCYNENEVGQSLVNGTSTLTVSIQARTTVKTPREYFSTATSTLTATSINGNAHIPTAGQHDMTSITQIGTSTSYYYGISKTVRISKTKTIVIIGNAVAGCSFFFAVTIFVFITVCACKSRKKSSRKQLADTQSSLNPDEESAQHKRFLKD